MTGLVFDKARNFSENVVTVLEVTLLWHVYGFFVFFKLVCNIRPKGTSEQIAMKCLVVHLMYSSHVIVHLLRNFEIGHATSLLTLYPLSGVTFVSWRLRIGLRHKLFLTVVKVAENLGIGHMDLVCAMTDHIRLAREDFPATQGKCNLLLLIAFFSFLLVCRFDVTFIDSLFLKVKLTTIDFTPDFLWLEFTSFLFVGPE